MADTPPDKKDKAAADLPADAPGAPADPTPTDPAPGGPVRETRRERRARKKQESQDETIQEEEAFYKEVQEELRAERTWELLKKYGTVLVLAAVLLVAGVAAFQYWRGEQESAQAESSNQFTRAANLLQQGKAKEAAERFGLIAREGSPGFAALARLRQGAARAQAGDLKGAIASYRSLAEDSGAPEGLRTVGTLMWALHAVDSAPPDEMLTRIKPLTANSSPWRHVAREISGYYLEKAKRPAEARKMFKSLADDATAPGTIRSRARDMLTLLGGE